MVTATNEEVEILKGRVIKGLEYCNDLWQKAKQAPDDQEYQKLMDQLDKWSKRLRELAEELKLSGYTGCVYEKCRWNNDNFICFGCTEANK